LEVAVDAWSADPTDEAQLAAVQQAWTVASASSQHLEMLQIGPAASSLVGIGGEDLRDAIYSWPTADTCSVDRALVAEDFASPDFFVTELVWAYGLDALEYLLFARAEGHTCPSQVQLDPAWTALSFEEIEQRRAAYARVVVAGVAEQARTLATRWSPEGDDFATALAGPGEGDSPYESDVQALDEVFRAMFYLDKQAKDGKLGVPLGLVEGCAAVPCIEMMEAPHSGVGAASIRANLEALRVMITGGPDPDTADGFDDLLVQLGHADIAETVLTDIDLAIAQADALAASPQQVALDDPDDLLALHTAVKRVTDALKGPFTMALMLTIPAEGAGDND
jgi:predicted lipoprotein